jgi:hypothetical protein
MDHLLQPELQENGKISDTNESLGTIDTKTKSGQNRGEYRLVFLDRSCPNNLSRNMKEFDLTAAKTPMELIGIIVSNASWAKSGHYWAYVKDEM